jgi:SET domain-containing protein
MRDMPKLNFIITPNVKVARSAPGAGLGLFAVDPIKKGTFIIEYTGIRLPTAQANQKGGKYLFEVTSRTTIDGTPRWNTARYINYSCKPNAEPVNDNNRIMINAIKNIAAGEEITYDYGKEYYTEFIKPHGCRCASCLAGNKPRYK